MSKSRSVVLPAGTIEISREVEVPSGKDVRGHPQGTTLRASGRFSGRALLVCKGRNIRLSGFAIDGNRSKVGRAIDLAPYDKTFASYYPLNGILAEKAENLTIEDMDLREIANFAILVSASKKVNIARVGVRHSGSLNAKNRNNTSGGILLEEGTENFSVRDSTFRTVRGNGVWTHSLYTSPRNARGVIAGNRFEEIARDAIQIGHATGIQVDRNTGTRIGYPVIEVDVEGGGTPVAIDTAGNVDRSNYTNNRFEEINGKCIDLDGFHNGEVSHNVCINRLAGSDYPFGHYGIVFNNTNPDMQSSNVRVLNNNIDGTKYGGIFVIGRGHTITGNRLINLNTARCNETPGCLYDREQPDLLRSGIYLGSKAERPDIASENRIMDNEISGHDMQSHCIIAAPGVALRSNTIERNQCRNQ